MQGSTEQLAADAHAPLPKSATIVRLHITPFNPSLYSVAVPAPLKALVDKAGGPSFHSVETFPERGFGYIELPAGDAQRLRQKLHGSTLKGMKLRVEAARPKRKAGAEDAEELGDKRERRGKKVKVSSHSGDGVLRGVELPAGRVVKRGWAEKANAKEEKKKQRRPASAEEREKEKKKPKKAKEVDTGQMIFRTSLPANVASNTADGEDSGKKSKAARKGRKKSAEVKEFDKTSKFPTFLRDSQVEKDKAKGVREFVEGKGWVDGEGNLVEEVKATRQSRPVVRKSTRSQSKSDAQKPSLDGDDDQESSESEESSVVSSDSDSDSDSDGSSSSAESHASDAITPSTEHPKASPTTPPKEVHPLEALFKRPVSRDKKPENLAPIKTSFSFFGAADDENQDTRAHDGHEALPRLPQTPFTRRDLENRGMRSAAPTPDTAAIGKRFRMPSVGREKRSFEQEDDDESVSKADDDHDDDGDEPMAEASASSSKDAVAEEPEEQTDFEKQFWARRGELNRAWKQRKREARKERRQAENRRAGGASLRQ